MQGAPQLLVQMQLRNPAEKNKRQKRGKRSKERQKRQPSVTMDTIRVELLGRPPRKSGSQKALGGCHSYQRSLRGRKETKEERRLLHISRFFLAISPSVKILTENQKKDRITRRRQERDRVKKEKQDRKEGGGEDVAGRSLQTGLGLLRKRRFSSRRQAKPLQPIIRVQEITTNGGEKKKKIDAEGGEGGGTMTR